MFLGEEGTMFLKFENCPSLAWFTVMEFSTDFIALSSWATVLITKINHQTYDSSAVFDVVFLSDVFI